MGLAMMMQPGNTMKARSPMSLSGSFLESTWPTKVDENVESELRYSLSHNKPLCSSVWYMSLITIKITRPTPRC